METAATAEVAAAPGVPFLGFRAASDGGSDPLHLLGFPAQFFTYRQLAGNNAAALNRRDPRRLDGARTTHRRHDHLLICHGPNLYDEERSGRVANL